MGPFEALLDGQAITAFQSDKVRALLAFLAVEMARPHPRETLAGLLWPNVPEGCAHHSLSQALSNLRSAIHDHETTPPFLLVAPQIQFNWHSDHRVDVEELGGWYNRETGKLEAGEENRLYHAVALYRGPFLEELFAGRWPGVRGMDRAPSRAAPPADPGGDAPAGRCPRDAR